MDLKTRYQQTPHDTALCYEYASQLFKNNEFRLLEQLFIKILPTTLNIKIWILYLKYVKIKNSGCLCEAYAHAFEVVYFHYDVFEIFSGYVEQLRRRNDAESVEKIRDAFSRVLTEPVHNLSGIFADYEAFELGMSKQVGRVLVAEKMLVYQNTVKTYQRLLPFIKKIEFDFVYKIVEIDERPEILKYFLETYWYRPEIYFIYNETFKIKNVLRRGVELTGDKFLKIYFMHEYGELLFLDTTYEKINFLSCAAKKGIDSFYDAMGRVGIVVGADCAVDARLVVYAASLCYVLSGDPSLAYSIFDVGLNKSVYLNESYFRFVVERNDIPAMRSLYAKIDKTNEIYLLKLNFELKYGNYAEYKKLLLDDAVYACLSSEEKKQIYSCKMLKAFENFNTFLGLDFEKDEFLFNFISCIPPLIENSPFNSIKSEEVVELLKDIDVA